MKNNKRNNEKESDSSFFNSSEKKITDRLLSFGKNGIQTGRVESDRTVKANFIHNKLREKNDEPTESSLKKKILFNEENIDDFYFPDPAPIDFFKDYKEKPQIYQNLNTVEIPKEEDEEDIYPILDTDQLYSSEKNPNPQFKAKLEFLTLKVLRQ